MARINSTIGNNALLNSSSILSSPNTTKAQVEDLANFTDCISEADQDSTCLLHTSDGRFAKTGGLLLKTPYDEVYKGIDRDTGNEIRWREIEVTRLDQTTYTNWMNGLKQLLKLNSKHILKYLSFERWSDSRAILITETITKGSLSDYLGSFKRPKIRVCREWFKQILSGLHYMHENNITHGHLTCDHIYINSNTGELKIGDISLVKLQNLLSEKGMFSRPLDDIHNFGLIGLEIFLAQLVSPSKRKIMINPLYDSCIGNKDKIIKYLGHVENVPYKHFIEKCIFAESGTKAEDLLKDPFFSTEIGMGEVLNGIRRKSKSPANAIKFPTLVISKSLGLPKEGTKPEEGECKAKLCSSSQNATKITLTIKIESEKASQDIIFKYDFEKDTPGKIIEEMIKEGIVSSELLPKVEKHLLLACI